MQWLCHRGGGGQTGQLAPQAPMGQPTRLMQIQDIHGKNGGRFTSFVPLLLPPPCTDATVDVFWSYDY